MRRTSRQLSLALLVGALLPSGLLAQSLGGPPDLPGEEPGLPQPRIHQSQITGGALTLEQIRLHGMGVFTSPFNKLDGFGDGPMNPADTTNPGGRPTLGNNGTVLRVNGLDAQTCLECHAILSAATRPPRLGIGGIGMISNSAIFQPTEIDVADGIGNGFAAFNGRLINPPFLFGSGAVELVGKEMTVELQRLKAFAQQNPDTDVALVAKGIDFGVLSYSNGAFDTSRVEGVDHDLVVRPFGRKGEFSTVRGFDVEALRFHMGMEPVEAVGAGVDADGDGVVNEVLVGELSALSIFNTTLEPPFIEDLSPSATRGAQRFRTLGCADCHVPFMHTNSPILGYNFPEVETAPQNNVYYSVDLRDAPMSFQPSPQGGIVAPFFSDLKRHDMGPELAENFGGELASQFITPRLWGIADTAPYLHDGRAMTLSEAILLHGGEGQAASDGFAALTPAQKIDLLSFLRSLRTPENPAADLLD